MVSRPIIMPASKPATAIAQLAALVADTLQNNFTGSIVKKKSLKSMEAG